MARLFFSDFVICCTRLLIVIMLLFFFSTSAKAERCWLADCKGLKGYVFVPRMLYDDKDDMCREESIFADANDKPYKTLPKVGTVVYPAIGGLAIFSDKESIGESLKGFYNLKREYEDYKAGKVSKLRLNGNVFSYYEDVQFLYKKVNNKYIKILKSKYQKVENTDVLIENCAKERYMFSWENANKWGGGIKAKIISYIKINDEKFAYIEILENPNNPK